MVKQLLVVFAVITTSLADCNQAQLFAQTSKNNVPLSAASTDQWTLRWDRSDDFNGEEVDWRKWNKSPENFGAWVWDNENNVKVSNGVLQITMRRLPTPMIKGRRPLTPYTSGMLKSHVTGTYGYYEARLKGAPLFPGVCPSFWLYSKINDSLVAKVEPRYSEVDIVEVNGIGLSSSILYCRVQPRCDCRILNWIPG